MKKFKKKSGDIIILHMCTINDNHMLYGSWDMKCGRQNFLSFWTVFCHFTPLTTRKIKILKNWKNIWRYHHFTLVYQKLWLDVVQFLRNGARWADDGWMDRQKKWHIEVNAPPKNHQRKNTASAHSKCTCITKWTNVNSYISMVIYSQLFLFVLKRKIMLC